MTAPAPTRNPDTGDHYPEDYDQPIRDCVRQLNILPVIGVHHVFLQWTCPTCGERPAYEVTFTDELHPRPIIHTSFRHAERADGSHCGRRVTAIGWRFSVVGLSVIGGSPEPANG